MSQIDTNIQPQAIIEEIKILRFSKTSKKDFFDTFASYIQLLSKSKKMAILEFEKDAYSLVKSDFKDEELLNICGLLAIKALKNSFAYERIRIKNISSKALMGIAIKLESDEKAFVLFICIEYENAQALNSLLLNLLLVSDVYLSFQRANQQSRNIISNQEGNQDIFKDIVDITSLLMYQDRFKISAMTFVNELARRFNAARVSLGWKDGKYVKTIAISHLESFTRNSEAVDALEAAFEECYDQNQEILCPNSPDEFVITYAHEEYAQRNKLSSAVSFPCRLGEDIKGVLVIEKKDGDFNDTELLTLRLISNQVTPLIDSLFIKDRGIFSSLLYKTKKIFSWWFGVNDTLMKFVATLTCVVLVYISMVDMEYKIEANGALTTDNILFVSAPFDSVVQEVNVHSGDLVKKDDFMLMLDTRELYLKYSEAISDVARYNIEKQKARGKNELANMKIAKAKIDQAEATKKRIEYYLEQAKITAPLSGVIVEGEHEELMGKPVSKGDMLIKVAKLEDFYLTMHVEENYIDDLKVGDNGEFIFLGKTKEKIAFEIDKIIPVAIVDANQKNSFLIKANFKASPSSWWRPGMSGVAKVDAGKRKIIWVLTHKMVDFLRLFFWI